MTFGDLVSVIAIQKQKKEEESECNELYCPNCKETDQEDGLCAYCGGEMSSHPEADEIIGKVQK